MHTNVSSKKMTDSYASFNTPQPEYPGNDDVEILMFPASPAQEAFIYLEKLFPSHPAFNVPVRFELKGVLDQSLLKAAFDKLAIRHEGLRTRFHEDNGKLFQVVAPKTTFPLSFTSVIHFTGTELDDELNRLGSVEARTPFDLSKDPLFRASLILVAPDIHILQITFHHSVADGWSIGIMTDELADFYNAALENRESQLAPLVIQYADFSVWQRDFLNSPALTQHLDYWKEKLKDYTELELPTDRPRPAVKSWDGDIVSLILRPSISEKVARISKDKGATMFHVFLAAFKAIANRYTGLEDIAVGSPVAGRTREELEPIIGTFINSVILRTDLSGDPSFGELVIRVRDNVTDAIAHQDLPFEYLVKALQPRRDAGRNPLFQVNFTHQRDFVKPVSFGGARLRAIPSRSPGAIFDLHFFMVERADGWRASCDFARDLFDRETAERLLKHFETFLDAAAGEPDLPLSQLPILTQEEQSTLHRWSGINIPYPSDRSLGELFLEQARAFPSRIALSHGNQNISYQQLSEFAFYLRDRMVDSGVRPGNRIALCAPSVPEMIAAQIAILFLGCTCVPLDPDYPISRLSFMLEDSSSVVLLTTADHADKFPESIKKIILSKFSEYSSSTVASEVSCSAESASHLFYTSGSTGTPKGVLVSHRGISRLACGGGFMQFNADDSFLQVAPSSFDASTREIWMPLLNGGRIVLTGEDGPSLANIARSIQEQNVTCLWLTAGLFQSMVDEQINDLKGLKYLLAGGDVLSPDHVRRAFNLLTNTTIINGYGPTENTTFTCCHTITRSDLDCAAIPIGRPVGNTTVYILDSQMRPVPVGIPGELFTGGDGLALGYLNGDHLSDSKFQVHPKLGRLYRTGDLCRWRTDGLVEFLGRIDSQVKVRGYRVEIGEIESRLASHPGVLQAKVAIRGDSAESKRIFGWVVASTIASPSSADLSSYLSEFLPNYMCPDAIMLIESMPLSANGKVNVTALPDPLKSRDNVSSNAPIGQTETTLALMWSELLGISDIGRDDNFFSLGGHSLMALRLFSRINREFDLSLPLASLIIQPTIRGLAGLIHPESQLKATTSSKISSLGHFVTLAEGRDMPPLFCIHGGDGGVLFLRDLAVLMPSNLALYAIESQELGKSGKITICSIEHTAADYLNILLDKQPTGPYFLTGYSFGGVIAHEIACQLVNLGHEVAFLGLLDTHNPMAPVRHYSLLERLSVFWRQNADIPILSRTIRVYQRFREGLQTKRRIQSEIKKAETSGPAESYSEVRRVQVREENWRAMQAYQPKSFKGRITLFKTSSVSDKFERPVDYGWANLALDGLEIVSVQGEHLTIFAPENITHLAKTLTSSLKSASIRRKDSAH